ncbi:MAG: peroxiredoxin family protein [Pseudomonadota bacterium]
MAFVSLNLKKLSAFVALGVFCICFSGLPARAQAADAKTDADGAASSVATAELGPPIGAVAPHDLSAQTARGGPVTFKALSGENGIALFFVRSVDWCPYCKAQASDISARIEDFENRGFNVAFVSYDSVFKQKKFAQARDFNPVLISDQSLEIINAFGLRNEKHSEGSRFYGIPHPAVFIIDRDRKIVAKLYEQDYAVNDKSYRNRPAVDIILSAIDAASE